MTYKMIVKTAQNIVLGTCIALMFSPMVASAKGWGVIAADEVMGEKDPYWGIGDGATKTEATSLALKNCKEIGGKNCQVILSYDECGAYAASKNYAGTGQASTKKQAEAKALAECNHGNCSIVTADCTEK